MEIYFLRHGRSKADDEKRFEGRYDSPLTDVGRKQANRRAINWKNENLKFHKIITSPLKRALETAQIIGDVLECEVEEDNDWMEMNNGQLAGLTYEEAQEKFPRPVFRNPYERIVNGTGESTWQLHSRAINALENVMQNKEGKYLVVAHGGILNATVRMIVGAQPPVNDIGLYFKFGDTGYLQTEYKPEKHIWIIKNFVPGDCI